MDQQQLFQLRQRADRDGDLSPSARLLFSEIINLNAFGGGCYKAYSTLADDLGISTRTVRRRRKELAQAGYITIKSDGDRRYLVPKWPDKTSGTGQVDRTKSPQPDKDVQTESPAPDNDGETPPDNDGEDRDIDNPAEVSECAHAREDGQEDEEKSRVQNLKRLKQGAWTKEEIRQHAKRKYGDPERWRTAIYQLAHPDYDPNVLVRDEWTEKIADPEAWAEAIWKGLKRRWQPTSVDAREDTYEDIVRQGDGAPSKPEVHTRPDDIRTEIR